MYNIRIVRILYKQFACHQGFALQASLGSWALNPNITSLKITNTYKAIECLNSQAVQKRNPSGAITWFTHMTIIALEVIEGHESVIP